MPEPLGAETHRQTSICVCSAEQVQELKQGGKGGCLPHWVPVHHYQPLLHHVLFGKQQWVCTTVVLLTMWQ